MTEIEIVGAVVGLAYLWLEYRASIWLWLAGVVMSLLYVYIFFEGKVYAMMCIQVYYLFASIYGWFRWRKDESIAGEEVRIRSFPSDRWMLPAGVFVALFGLTAWILSAFTDSPVPVGDAFTTALSVVAMYLLAHKYVEQWLLWIVVNAVSAALYFYLGLYPTGALYGVYAAVSVAGFFRWKKIMQEN